MGNFLSIIAGTIIWFIILTISYYFVEHNKIPYLQYKPFICFKCFNFWLQLFSHITIYELTQNLLLANVGIGLATLNTIAIIIDERNRFK